MLIPDYDEVFLVIHGTSCKPEMGARVDGVVDLLLYVSILFQIRLTSRFLILILSLNLEIRTLGSIAKKCRISYPASVCFTTLV